MTIQSNPMNSWEIKIGEGPIIATAIHDGHGLSDEVAANMKLPKADRLREEDPFTGDWARLVPTHIIAKNSRFQVDLNRALWEAVYKEPKDAWGLDMWHEKPSASSVERAMAEHVEFYACLEKAYREKVEQFGRVVVLDLHSYNHLRDGPTGVPADPQGNPEVNIGTGTMIRSRWGLLIDKFITELGEAGNLDVRENVKFIGRQHGSWAHSAFPDSVCVLSVEFKKTFMNEWTGELNTVAHNALGQALVATFDGLTDSLKELGARI